MLRGLGAEELNPEREKHDTEFTLGPAMLLAILCGLLLLCGLFFALGYRAGRRSAPLASITVTQTAGGQTVATASGGTLSKPPARGLVPATPPSSPQLAQQTNQSGSLEGSPSGSALSSYGSSGNIGNPVASQPQVRSALPQPPSAAQSSNIPANSNQVQPALSQGSIIMVQVAAVSHMEDANVLMGALRKRGYAVMARRGFPDNLIHVQIGPFPTRSDAIAMSQKLLGDGYNAVVLP
jgi:DedD protein